MKRNLKFATLFSASAGTVIITALAVTSAHNPLDQPAPPANDTGQLINEPAGAQTPDADWQGNGKACSAYKLRDTEVIDSSDTKLGQVKDIMFDLQTGRTPFVIISRASDGQLAAIPASMLSPQAGDKALIFNGDTQKLDSAPVFAMTDLQDSSWCHRTTAYYGVEPRATAFAAGPAIYEPSGAAPPQLVTGWEQDSEANGILHRYQLGKGQGALVDNRVFNNVASQDYYAQYPANSAGAPVTEAAGAQLPASGTLTRSSDLIGMSVKDAKGETVGDVKDVVMDWNSGRIAYIVLDPSGLSDLSGKYLAVPPRAFAQSGDRTLSLGFDKQALESAPAFDRSSWPSATDPAALTPIYQFYNQTPYWSGARAGQPAPPPAPVPPTNP